MSFLHSTTQGIFIKNLIEKTKVNNLKGLHFMCF
jgi:hypothetical protein